jgi:imidazolonepropionase-like amidohydrolase
MCSNQMFEHTVKIGTLEAGKAADVVAVAGNVLADIRALDHPTMAMKGGRFVVGGRQ